MRTPTMSPTSLPVVVRGDYVGCFGQAAFWCAVAGPKGCEKRFSCMGGVGPCEIGPDSIVENFRSRHPEAIRRYKDLPRSAFSASGRLKGAPDLVIWRWKGAKKMFLIEVKTQIDRVSDAQVSVMKRLAGWRPRSRLAKVVRRLPTASRKGVQMVASSSGHRDNSLLFRIPASADLAWDAVEQVSVAKGSHRTAAAARKAGAKRAGGKGAIRHLGGLREARVGVDSGGKWVARAEIAALFALLRNPGRSLPSRAASIVHLVGAA